MQQQNNTAHANGIQEEEKSNRNDRIHVIMSLHLNSKLQTWQFITTHIITAHRGHVKVCYFGIEIRADFSANTTIFFLGPASDSSETCRTMLR